jgi:hypothetical protein
VVDEEGRRGANRRPNEDIKPTFLRGGRRAGQKEDGGGSYLINRQS